MVLTARYRFIAQVLMAQVACSSLARAAEKPVASPRPYFDQYLAQLIDSKDYLGLRIFLKAYGRRHQKNPRPWQATRRALDFSPQAGYDLLYMWKHIAPMVRTPTEKEFMETYENGQTLMLQKKFALAVQALRPLAAKLRSQMDASKQHWRSSYRNLVVLYPYVLQALGRAHYGAGEYKDALEVYDWIPAGYVAFRQVLFEKMWTAYQLGDAGKVLASIAAQKSAYMSPFLEPEAYLIQTYIYKKLCRSEELAGVLKELKVFHAELKSGAFDLEKWSAWDTENFAQYQLLAKGNVEARNGIGKEVRASEMKAIYDTLNRNYSATHRRLLRDIGKVIAFSSMAALSNTSRDLKPITKMPSKRQLLKAGLEIWPFDMGEEWVDEIGTQTFLGASQCAATP